MSTYSEEFSYPSVEPTATIYMDGLLALCFKGEQRCTVAVNKQSTHIPEFKIFKWASGECEEILNLSDNYQRVEINVNKASVRAVKVYTGPSRMPSSTPPPFDERHNFVENCVDLEGERGHKQPVKNKVSTLWPRFYINDGLFCTYKRSSGKFDLQKPSGSVVKALDEVALAIAADIFLKAGEFIEVTVDGMPLRPPVKLDFGARYEIGITNDCRTSLGKSDFYLHYKALDVSGLSATEFHLEHRGDPVGSPDPTPLGRCVRKPAMGPASDRTPCMAIVFGDTTDFID